MESSKPRRVPRRKARLVSPVEDEELPAEPPRERSVIHAELRSICLEHCSPDNVAWLKQRFPNIWAEPGQQLELFR